MCAGSLAALTLLAGAAGCGGDDADRIGPSATAAASKRTASQADRFSAPPRDLYSYRVVTRVETRQAARFALLRTRPEGLPRSTRRILGAPMVGMSWRLAQRIPVSLPGAYWLVPAKRHLCVVSQERSGVPAVGTNCAATQDALAHGIASITVSPPSAAAQERLIVGVAPDGSREARINTQGVYRAVRVVAGVFVLRDDVASPPDVITLL